MGLIEALDKMNVRIDNVLGATTRFVSGQKAESGEKPKLTRKMGGRRILKKIQLSGDKESANILHDNFEVAAIMSELERMFE